MAVSSLNCDYGITWGSLSKAGQQSPDKTPDAGFKDVLSRAVANESPPAKTNAAFESASDDSKELNEAAAGAGAGIDADTAYRHGLLNPNKLPKGLEWGDGSCSLDVVAKPEFRVTEAGNIERIDILTGGRQYFTLIPNTEWRLSTGGGEDSAPGTVYNRQESAYRAVIAYATAVDYSPAAYIEGQHERKLDSMLALTKKGFSDKWPRKGLEG
ncbi:MAG: hypothetical protein HPY50_07905 [Firmicutes bacterium]|nr:hypothetical protein [Bacillota bacterium]